MSTIEDLNYIGNKRNPSNGINRLTVRRKDINANNSDREKAEVLNTETFGVVKKHRIAIVSSLM